jgi:transposase-like protein
MPTRPVAAPAADTAATVVRMTGVKKYEVVCPHCKKSFRGELIGADESRQGFKCPHCRLFVPLERAETHAAD